MSTLHTWGGQMGHYPETHPTTGTFPAAVSQLPPSPAQGVSVPGAGQEPPWQAAKLAVPPATP